MRSTIICVCEVADFREFILKISVGKSLKKQSNIQI